MRLPLLLVLSCMISTANAACGILAACENGGTCNIGSGVCSCTPAYTGDLCETELTLTIEAVSVSGNEGDTLSFTVRRTPATTVNAVTVTLTTGGSATAGSDYNISPLSLSYGASEDAKTSEVAIVDDDENELDETVIVTATIDGSTVTTSKTFTISQNDAITVTRQSSPGTSLTEGDAPVTYKYDCVLPPGTTSATFTVSGTPVAGASSSDATVTGSVLTCTTSATLDVVVTVQDDSTPEVTETVNIVLASTTAYFTGDDEVAVTITDNDALQITSNLPTTVEEGSSPLSFSVVQLSFPNGVAVPVELTVAVTGVTALNSDISTTPSNSITFTYDETDPTSRQDLDDLTITILNDNVAEPDKTFQIDFTSDYQLTGDTDSTITLEDDETDVLTIAEGATTTIGESDGTLTLTVSRTITFHALDVDVSTIIPTSGDVISSSDITILTDDTHTFPAGSSSITIDVTITPDSIAEVDEDFIVRLTPTENADPVEIRVTIVDDDPDTITVTSALVANENDGTATVDIKRTLSVNAAVVQVTTTDGTATAGADYTALSSQNVNFAAGDSTASFTITLDNDGDEEDDETFTFVIFGTGFVTTAAQTFYIVEDDGVRAFDCRRKNQDCAVSTAVCSPELPNCDCVGTPAREGRMCNIITAQKDGAACTGVDCGANGECLDDSGTTSCACHAGYYGDNCQHFFLQAGCSLTSLTFFANPIGNFEGKIYVKGQYDVGGCEAIEVNNPVDSSDAIDDTLEGYYLEVNHDDCGAISPVEGASETSYSRVFIIEYHPPMRTGLDQSITVSCVFDTDGVVVGSNIFNLDSGPLDQGSAQATFSPVEVVADRGGNPVVTSDVIPLAEKLCVTINIPDDFGGLEIIDIEFNNTEDTNTEKWKVFEAGCPTADTESVFVNEPFYSTNTKIVVKFCFYAFKFHNTDKLAAEITLKICVDADDCDQATSCSVARRKRQATPTREEVVGATFTIAEDGTSSSQQADTNLTPETVVPTTKDCQLRVEFIPTVIALCAIILLLLVLCLCLTCRLVRRREKKTEEKQHTYYR